MNKKILLTFFILSNILCLYGMDRVKDNITNISFASKIHKDKVVDLTTDLTATPHEKQDLFIKINEGLSTTVRGKITYITFHKMSAKILSTYVRTKETNLQKLILYKKPTIDPDQNPVIRDFSPIVLEESSQEEKPFKDLGLFNKDLHKEALRALTNNKAVYCLMGPGAIIYNKKDQPHPEKYRKEIVNHIKQDKRLQPAHTFINDSL